MQEKFFFFCSKWYPLCDYTIYQYYTDVFIHSPVDGGLFSGCGQCGKSCRNILVRVF